MYIGKQYTQTQRSVDVRPFACSRCSYTGEAVVLGVGQGHGNSAYFLDDEGASRRAVERAGRGAQRNAAQTLSLARCPSCGARDTGAVVTFWAGYVAAVVGATFGMLVVGAVMFLLADADPVIFTIFGPMGLIAGGVVAWSQAWKWTTVDERVLHVDA